MNISPFPIYACLWDEDEHDKKMKEIR